MGAAGCFEAAVAQPKNRENRAGFPPPCCDLPEIAAKRFARPGLRNSDTERRSATVYAAVSLPPGSF